MERNIRINLKNVKIYIRNVKKQYLRNIKVNKVNIPNGIFTLFQNILSLKQLIYGEKIMNINQIKFSKLLFILILSLIIINNDLLSLVLNNKNNDFPILFSGQEENALIYVYRNDEYFGSHISFYVYVNNPNDNQMLAGFTKGHQYIYFFLKPGKYTIFSKADNIDKLNIKVDAGQIYCIKQIPLPGIKAANEIKLVQREEAKQIISKYEEGNIYRKSFL